MQASVDSAQQASETLKTQVMELKRKIDEGERTATTLVARKNAAQAQRKVAEALAGVNSADNAFAALGTFEEKVAREEATAQAFNTLASAGKDDELEKQFAALGHAQRGFRAGGVETRAAVEAADAAEGTAGGDRAGSAASS